MIYKHEYVTTLQDELHLPSQILSGSKVRSNDLNVQGADKVILRWVGCNQPKNLVKAVEIVDEGDVGGLTHTKGHTVNVWCQTGKTWLLWTITVMTPVDPHQFLSYVFICINTWVVVCILLVQISTYFFCFGGMRDRLWQCCPKQTNNTIFDMAYGLTLNWNHINYSKNQWSDFLLWEAQD